MLPKSEKRFKTTEPGGSEIELLCVRPNQDVIDGARREYNVKFAIALREGGLTRTEAEDIIEQRKLWSDKHEDRLQKLRFELRSKEVELNKIKDLKKGEELSRSMNKLRNDMSKLVNSRDQILNKTCESYAEGAQNQYLLVRCILRPDERTAYFESIEAFKILENSQLIGDCLGELLLFLHDTTVEELTNTPESKWLVNNKLKDDKTGFWIRDGKLFTDDGKMVNNKGEYLNEETGERCDYWGFPLDPGESDGNQTEATAEKA
jgi:hypothetical protein